MMKRNGFTLPELLAALVIVALLIGLGGGNLVAYGEKQRAREMQAHSDFVRDALLQCLALEGQYPDPKELDGQAVSVGSFPLDSLPKIRTHLAESYKILFIDEYVYTYTYVSRQEAYMTLTRAP